MNPINIIFHIGSGKTGSSSIQKTLNENKELLSSQGVIYAGLNLELICKESWNKLPWGFNQLSGEELAYIYLKKINEITKNSKINMIILSNEGFLEHSEKLSHLYKAINEDNKYNLSLCAYVRAPENWMVSGYQQWGVKHKHYRGNIISADEYIKSQPYEPITRSLRYLSENGFNDCLSVNSVEFVGDVVKHFTSSIGLLDLIEFKENESLSERDKCLTYFYNDKFSQPVMPAKSSVLIERVERHDVKNIIDTTSIFESSFDESYINGTKETLNTFLPEEQSYSLGTNLSPKHKNIENEDLIKMSQEIVNLNSIVSHLNPSLLRDIAISLEKVDVKYARYIMLLAKHVRPKGPTIIAKINEYNKLINSLD